LPNEPTPKSRRSAKSPHPTAFVLFFREILIGKVPILIRKVPILIRKVPILMGKWRFLIGKVPILMGKVTIFHIIDF
jgi:hypothetical protein